MNDEARTPVKMCEERRRGKPAIDPTENVKALSESANKRQDDLREHESLLIDEKIRRVDDLRVADTKRVDDLRKAESRRVDEQAVIRSEFQDKLALAEAKRIDAIRAVDVGAVAVASERATQQATVLANQVSTSADALRTLVATTASAMAAQSQNMTQQFTERLAALEHSQYESKGRTAVADPQMERLAAVVERLALKMSGASGVGAGINMAWVVGLGALGGLGVVTSIILGLIAIFKP
jgi:hypothetical protein